MNKKNILCYTLILDAFLFIQISLKHFLKTYQMVLFSLTNWEVTWTVLQNITIIEKCFNNNKVPVLVKNSVQQNFSATSVCMP